MLVQQLPQVEQVEIECNQIKKFTNQHEAELYANMKGYMVIHEQDKNIWRTMPKTDDFLTGGCYEEVK